MIKDIKILPKELKVIFTGKKIDKFPNIWLRDHAKDEENWDNHRCRSHHMSVQLR